jgi:hypothetical protein
LSAGATACGLAVPLESSSFGEWFSIQPFSCRCIFIEIQCLLFMRFPDGTILALHARGTAVQTVLLKTPILSDGRAVLSLGKDPGIIDLSAQLSQPMSE